MRPSVHVFLAISLDGFIAGPDDDLSWLAPYGTDDPEATGYAELMRQADTLVMGRRTFDVVSGFEPWPYSGKRVVVLTHRDMRARPEVGAYGGSLVDLLARLQAEGCRQVYLDGGSTVRAALAQGLVDTLTLSLAPVILGAGVRLFDHGLPTTHWTSTQARQLASGLVQVRYRRATGEAPRAGSDRSAVP